MRHKTPHPLAGTSIVLPRDLATHPPCRAGDEYRIEDWWDRVAGKSWMICDGNPACLIYAIRGGLAGLPTDDEVVYGKVGALGHLVHVSELAILDDGRWPETAAARRAGQAVKP